MPEPLVSFRNVDVTYGARSRKPAHVLKQISLDIHKGETLGLVGESGAGKSTIGNAILGVAPVTSGSLVMDQKSLIGLSKSSKRALTARIQTVFQDPLGSLNPMRTIGQSLADPLRAHGIRDRQVIREKIELRLSEVGLSSDIADRMPAMFSGGQLQRIVIARALMLDPDLVILDEPVAALDLSVQGQVINLLTRLQREKQLTYLFVTHDMAVVRHLAQRIVVLSQGRIVEQGHTETVCSAPADPYTRKLLDAVLLPDPVAQRAREKRMLL